MVLNLFCFLTVGVVLNVYEAVDVLALIQDETYENLRLMLKDALYLRSDNVLPIPLTPLTTGLRRRVHLHTRRHIRLHLRNHPSSPSPPFRHRRRQQTTRRNAHPK